MTKPNIYMKALEIGFNSGNDGISYDNLVNQLVNQNYKINDDVFWIWYLRNFEHRLRAYFSVDPSVSAFNEQPSKSDALELCADSVMQYVEYLELKEARESTKKALKHARIAIIIAIVSIFLNLIQSVFSSELTFDKSCNQQKDTKTNQVKESQVKEELEYPHNHQDELNDTQKELVVTDTIQLDK